MYHKPLPRLTKRQLGRFGKQFTTGLSWGCWLWTGPCDEHGRARFKCNGFKFIAARVAYFVSTGRDPRHRKVLHSCDNAKCVRPSHLWLGSQADNIADMNQKGRHGRTGARGQLQPNAKLTPRQVRIIRKSRLPNVALANRFNVNPSLISRVKRREAWTHV